LPLKQEPTETRREPRRRNSRHSRREDVKPYNMCAKRFPTTLAKSASEDAFPFGLFFADADTLYVADEGNGTATYDPATGSYSAAAAQTTAGLQKWVFNGTQWNLAYTLSTGLNLGQPSAALRAGEQFVTVRSAGYGEVLRGVSFTPGTSTGHSLGS
jgi:hypothetical protein